MTQPLSNRVHLGNAAFIAEHLLDLDVCGAMIKNDHKFSLEISALRDALHRYRYATAKHQPRGFSTIEWVEKIAYQLIRETRHCVDKLTPVAKQQLSRALVNWEQRDKAVAC